MGKKQGKDYAKLVFYSLLEGGDDAEAIAYLDDNRTLYSISNAEYRSAVYCIASRIKKNTQEAPLGSWVALCHENHHLWHAVFFALLKCGYNVLFIDPEFDDKHIEQCMKASGTCIIVSDRIIDSSDILTINYDDMTNNPFGAEESDCLDDQRPWGQLLAYCTSGTTGDMSKFPVHSMDKVHESIDVCASTLLNNVAFRKAVGAEFKDSLILLTLPLNHNYGFEFYPTFRRMGFRVCFFNTRSVLDTIAAVKEQNVSLLPSVPLVWKTMLQILMSRYKKANKDAFQSLFGIDFRMGFSTGSTITDAMRRTYANMGFTICNAYGASETPYAYIGIDPMRDCFNIDMSSFIKCVRLSNGALSEKGIGELLFKDGAAFVGYLTKDGITPPSTDKDGFIATGDYFELSNEGARYLGRRKNMIACQNGKNIYPEELEANFSFLSNIVKQYRIVGIDNKPVLFLYMEADKQFDNSELLMKVKKANDGLDIYKKISKLIFSKTMMPSSAKGVLSNKLLFDYEARPENYVEIILVGRG